MCGENGYFWPGFPPGRNSGRVCTSGRYLLGTEQPVSRGSTRPGEGWRGNTNPLLPAVSGTCLVRHLPITGDPPAEFLSVLGAGRGVSVGAGTPVEEGGLARELGENRGWWREARADETRRPTALRISPLHDPHFLPLPLFSLIKFIGNSPQAGKPLLPEQQDVILNIFHWEIGASCFWACHLFKQWWELFMTVSQLQPYTGLDIFVFQESPFSLWISFLSTLVLAL